jgi:hypothetical protein
MLSKEIQLEVTKAMLPLMEEFYIKGRFSPEQTAAYFVRIGGCDRLSLCDVKESRNAALHAYKC